MNKKLVGVMTVIAALSASAVAEAVYISITGTADDTALGYTQGQEYTFTWVLRDDFTGGADDSFDPESANGWTRHYDTDPDLWLDVYGDGLAGTYDVSPGSGTSSETLNAMHLPFEGPPDLQIYADNYFHNTGEGHSMGLTVDGVDVVQVDASFWGIELDPLSAFENPAAYFSGYDGTYTADASGSGNVYIMDTNLNHVQFTASSMSIQTVPEPAVIVLVSLFGAGTLAVRRLFMM